jgi:hypothetical protein
MSLIISIGKLSGEGIPPASEMTPGSETTLRISRIALTVILLVLAARSFLKFMIDSMKIR